MHPLTYCLWPGGVVTIPGAKNPCMCKPFFLGHLQPLTGGGSGTHPCLQSSTRGWSVYGGGWWAKGGAGTAAATKECWQQRLPIVKRSNTWPVFLPVPPFHATFDTKVHATTKNVFKNKRVKSTPQVFSPNFGGGGDTASLCKPSKLGSFRSKRPRRPHLAQPSPWPRCWVPRPDFQPFGVHRHSAPEVGALVRRPCQPANSRFEALAWWPNPTPSGWNGQEGRTTQKSRKA